MRSVASILATLFSRADWLRAGFDMAKPGNLGSILTWHRLVVTGLLPVVRLSLVGSKPRSWQKRPIVFG